MEGGLGGNPGLDAVAGALVGGGVADDAAWADVCAGEFELGFDEDDGVAAGFEDGEGGGEDEGEGDEGDVGDDEVHEFRDIGGGHVADVEVFAADDAGVIAEFPDELVGSDIVGVDSSGAVLEEAVGETAGGSADIEGDEAGDVDVEVVQGAFEFEAAAADVARGFFDAEDGVEGNEGAGFEAGLIVDEDLAGEDEAFGLFAGGAEALLNESLIQTGASHGEGLAGLGGAGGLDDFVAGFGGDAWGEGAGLDIGDGFVLFDAAGEGDAGDEGGTAADVELHAGGELFAGAGVDEDEAVVGEGFFDFGDGGESEQLALLGGEGNRGGGGLGRGEGGRVG